MKSFKKSIVFLMVAALVFGTVAPAFAATPSDVLATSYEDAVGKLVALGVISGYEDGTFQPEKAITRAEFAKIACYVVGQQDAANLSKGTATKFSDVPSTHWASGFISVASNQGLLKGYPNGTFKPEANVTYAEAITILVRALGMSPVVEGKGTWPANYMAKAAEVGMFDDVTGLVGNDNAVRGNIAKLAMNTMETEKWAANGYNDKGEINYGPKTGVTLLSDRYKKYANSDGELDIVKDYYVTGTRIVKDMNDNVVTLDTDLDANPADDVTMKVVDGLDMSQYLGCKIDYLRYTDSSTDKYVSFVENKSTVVTGKITEVKTSNKVTVNGKDYDVASSLLSGSPIMVNYAREAYENFATLTSDVNGGTKTVMGRLVIDPDTSKVTSISVVTPETLSSGTYNSLNNVAQFVVREVKTNGAVTNYAGATQFDLDDITDNDSKDKKETIFVKNGKLATKADIKVGDVVVKMGDFVFITDNKVTGKVTGITTKDEFTVNGVKYSKASAGALMTKSGKIEDADNINTTITDYLNKDVTLSLDNVGDYVLLSGSVNASAADQYGMLTQEAWQSSTPDANGKRNYYVELRTSAGEKRTFQITGSDDAIDYAILGNTPTGYNPGANTNHTDLTNAAVKGRLIRYVVSADGKIDAKDIELVTNGDSTSDYDYVVLSAGTITVNDDAKLIYTNPSSKYYFSDTESVILNNKAGTVEKATNWDALSSSDTVNVFSTVAPNATYPSGITACAATLVVDHDTNIIKVLAIAASTYITSNDKVYGVVTADPYYGLDSDNNSTTFVKMFNDGSEKTYEVSSSSIASAVYGDNKLEVGDFVVYTLNSDNEVSGIVDETDKTLVVTNDGNHFDTSYVKSFGDSIVTFDNNGGSARLDTDAKVYDATDMNNLKIVSTSEIKSGIMARAIDSDHDGLADVVVILSK